MLTKTDLQAIQKLVRTEIKSEVDPLKNEMSGLKNDIEIIKKEVKPIKSMQTNINKIKKDVKIMIDMFNRDDMR